MQCKCFPLRKHLGQAPPGIHVAHKQCFSRACHAGTTNPEHYIVATQEKALRQTLGGLPGGASIFTNVNGMHMEPPSDSQRNAIEQVAKLSISACHDLPALSRQEVCVQ